MHDPFKFEETFNPGYIDWNIVCMNEKCICVHLMAIFPLFQWVSNVFRILSKLRMLTNVRFGYVRGKTPPCFSIYECEQKTLRIHWRVPHLLSLSKHIATS